MERFLYRLSQSAHADRFILKGALMLRVWHSPELRPTMDIDMLGKTSNKEADIITQIRDILSMDVEKEVTTAVDGFLAPVVAAISSGKPSPTNWIASGQWS